VNVDDQQRLSEAPPKNLICNFRAPNVELWRQWHSYTEWVKNQGLDICRVTIGLGQAFMTGTDKALSVPGSQQTVNITMQNQFLYQVAKPRREPFSLSCVKTEYQRTFSSILFEAYVLEHARELNREFSFRDFLELKHDAFRRIVLRLKRKGKIVANPARTCPRFYFLPEKLHDYVPGGGTTE
jgi:hypothetical protein